MITGYLIGDSELIKRMEKIHPNAQKSLLEAVTRLAIQLQRHVIKNKLSGSPLKVRTGTLRRSINEMVKQTGTETTASVGTNLEYARIHEYGGTIQIKQHQRRLTMVFGHPVQERMISIRAHNATFPCRSFLRSAMKDMEIQIKNGMTKALARAVKNES